MTERAVAVPDEGTRPTACVLLLVESDRNRALLADQLEASFEVRTAADDPFADPQFDVCLLDPPSLREYEDRLTAAKTAAEPTFLPYLLLAERPPDDFSEDIWDVVDEVIQRPMSRAALDARLSNLLQRRRLSLELARETERSKRRFESLFRSIPDPVVVVSPDGTITGANEAFARAFGLESQEVRNRSIRDLDLESDAAVEPVLLRIAEEESSTTTTEWRLEDGDPFVTELNTDTVAGPGQTAERIGVFRDITQRVEREEELERQNRRLEEFADVIAHDLRNPLHVAQAQLDVARETNDERHFDVIERSQDRMEQMIDELLVMAKHGQAVLDPAPTSLERAAERAWQHVETSGATLEVDLDRADAILADEGRLYELLENLIRNAVEHDEETVTIRVGTLEDASGFYVEDDGSGIPPERRDDVFEEGYTDSEDGTGFGLSIVERIVESHEWTVTITDGEMGGARFEISGVEFA